MRLNSLQKLEKCRRFRQDLLQIIGCHLIDAGEVHQKVIMVYECITSAVSTTSISTTRAPISKVANTVSVVFSVGIPSRTPESSVAPKPRLPMSQGME